MNLRRGGPASIKLVRPFAVLILLLAALAGRSRALRVHLTEADGPAPRLSLHTGDELRIDLATQPSAGFRWTVRQDASTVLTEVGHATNQSGRFSPSGLQSFVWQAFAPGVATLRLDYSRGYGTEKTFTVELAVSEPALAADSPGMLHFTGRLPCADCTGIRQQLTLYGSPGEGSAHGTAASPFIPAAYLETLDYAELPGQPHIAIQTGVCKRVRGDPADANATLYVLEPAPGQPATLYLVQGSRLVPVDAQGVPLPAPPGSGADSALHLSPEP
jgi:predicted secreted protein